ncbi:MAG: hypothetical protein ACP6IY_19700 [Promethearchaeia archaeon]
MVNWNIKKQSLKAKYNIEILDSDEKKYKNYMNKGMIGPNIFILCMTGGLLFIIFGILLGELATDQYTLIPLAILILLLFISINDLQKKANENEQKFIAEIKRTRGFETPVYPKISNSKHEISQDIKKPIPAVECPICKHLIPIGSNPCPKCHSKLLWE